MPPAPEHVPFAVLHLGPTLRLESANRAARDLLGLSEDDHDWARDKVARWLPEVAKLPRRGADRTQGGHHVHKVTARRADGREIPVEACLAKLPEVDGYALTLTGLDARHARLERLVRANEELTRERDEALEQSRAKTMTLMRIAEAFDEPLCEVSARADVLLHDAIGLGRGMRDDLGRINEVADQLLGVLRSVLDLAAIEAGRVGVLQDRVAVGGDLASLVERCRPRARALGNSLVFTEVGEVGEAYADRERVLQTTEVLIAHALQRTADGTIEVRLLREPSAGTEQVVVEVRDTGVGPLPKLGMPYGEKEDEAGGFVGIGLVVAGEFARLMGGHLVAEDTEGPGGVLRLQLPAFARQHDLHPPDRSVTGLPVPRRVDQNLVQVDVHELERRSAILSSLQRGGWGARLAGEQTNPGDAVVLVAPSAAEDARDRVIKAAERNPGLPVIAVLTPSVAPGVRLELADVATTVTVEEEAEPGSWDEALHTVVMRAIMLRSMQLRASNLPSPRRDGR